MMSRPIEIIAECGINFQGDMYLATSMIHTAKECGADTAKFQVYDPETTLDRNDPVLSPWWDTIVQTELDFKDVEFLKGWCEKEDIGFLASAFDVERVEWLTRLGVDRYKVAARTFYDRTLADAIVKAHRPVILSLSGKYLDENRQPFPWSDLVPGVKVLYCVSEYPTPLSHLNFRKETFAAHDGFSDHTIGITASVMAMSLGATIIEKHFTLDKSLPGPDHICSADPDELYRLCQMRDDIEEILYADQLL